MLWFYWGGSGLSRNRLNNMETKLIIADSERDSNMFYATGILIPDDFIYLEKNGRKIIYVSDLEFNRAKKTATVDEVVNISAFKKRDNRNTFSDILKSIFREHKIKKVLVPGDFKMKYAELLVKNKIKIEVKPGLFFEERNKKSKKEIEWIAAVQRINEKAMSKAVALIKKSKIRKDKKLEFQGKNLTSEFIKKIIDIEFLENNCISEYNIVSCGEYSADPHEPGKGYLIANQPIVIDIFPRSRENRYFSDMTRTVVRGKASPAIKKIYETVLAGQKLALDNIKAGVKGKYIHNLVQNYFTGHGYPAGEKDGKVQGFIHGTGHGVGLDIHEAPNLSAESETILEAGNIVTVEPGLYYPGIGGVRIEDIVVVAKEGCKNLTKFPKNLEI